MECVTVGGAMIYLGDCRDILPTLGRVDALVMDAPYGIGLRNGDVDGHRSDRWDTVIGDESQNVGNAALQWGRERDLPIVAFASPWKPWPGRWRNLIVWDKGGAVGGGGDIATCLKRSWELIQVWNPRPLNGPRAESVWRFPISPRDTELHICAKPVALMCQLLAVFTRPDDVVCDPTMGSGTTALACFRTGRSFIGCEVDPRHFETAVERIRTAEGVGGLFESTAVPSDLFAESTDV
jgi:hypothetical protein